MWKEGNKMKINQFLKEKKWSIILGVAFLAILAVIAGIFSYGIDRKITSLDDQIDRLSASIPSIETSSSAIKSSIDGIIQEIDGIVQEIDVLAQIQDTKPVDQTVDSEVRSKLEDILKYISGLDQKVESLKMITEAGKQPTEAAEETIIESTEETVSEIAGETITAAEGEPISVPDTTVPGVPDNPDNQAQSTNTIKAGQDFTVTVKADEVSNLYGYQFNLNYDNKKATYKGNLKSSVSEISTIFKKDMNDHLLVGATMIGNTPGYSGQNVTVCTMAFTATEDIDPSNFTIDGVGTVDAEQNYIENIDGWSIDVKAE